MTKRFIFAALAAAVSLCATSAQANDGIGVDSLHAIGSAFGEARGAVHSGVQTTRNYWLGPPAKETRIATVTGFCTPQSYTGNGSTTVFTFPCKFQLNGDLVVKVTDTSGTVTTKALNTDYTVTGAGSTSGTITFGSAPASGYKISIIRNVDNLQELSLRSNRTPNLASIEDELDKLAMGLQQAQAGGTIVSGDVSAAPVTVDNTLTARTLAVALASLPIPVEAFGAICNGTADDHLAIQACVTAKTECTLPGRTCSMGTSTLSIPSGHVLSGKGMASSILKYGGTGCAVSFEATMSSGLRSMAITTPGSSSTERGICLTNATGNSLRNTFADLNIIGLTNPPTTGSYGIYIHSTTTNSLYYSEFLHVFTLDYDRGVELLGDPSQGGANAHWFHGYSANADNTGIYFDGSASDNYVQGHCNASGQTFAQKCFILGDGTNTVSGNEIHLVTDQSVAGNHNGGFTVSASAHNNFVWQVNEGTATDVMNGDSSNFMFNTAPFATSARQAWLPPQLLSGGTTVTTDLFVGQSHSDTATLLKTNTDYTIGAHDRNVCSAGLTGAHTFTLLTAVGRDISICDSDGTVGASNTLTIAPPATGRVNGSTSGVILAAAWKSAQCHSSTASGLIWSCVVTP